jgi:hypothetical protein
MSASSLIKSNHIVKTVLNGQKNMELAQIGAAENIGFQNGVQQVIR